MKSRLEMLDAQLRAARVLPKLWPLWWLRVTLWELDTDFNAPMKRLMDVTVSALALVVLLPVFALIALCVKLDSRGPVFFIQRRVGTFGHEFPFYKFRSMRQDAGRLRAHLKRHYNQSADGVIFKMREDPRITRVGRFLRRTSLDELPQLWNVLCGDMSLVGPRPPMPDELREYSLEERKRLDVKPGITGLWQVSGRSEVSFKQQVELDKEYISRQGFFYDIRILLRTIPTVLGGKGAY